MHLQWLLDVNSNLLEGKPVTDDVVSDAQLCEFGKWYHSEDRQLMQERYPSIRSILLQVEEPHENLHKEILFYQE